MEKPDKDFIPLIRHLQEYRESDYIDEDKDYDSSKHYPDLAKIYKSKDNWDTCEEFTS